MVFDRVLISNNGMAAAKFLISMNSVRSLMPEGKRPQFFGLVSNDDLQANPTYIQQLDYIIQVPSGPSANNYGNVDLIVELATTYKCDAVWPGWGHASENYALAQALESRGITWIGPSSETMIRLGDKVESLLQAQRVGVPCTPWSGVNASSAVECGLYSEEQVLAECDRIGYPVMIKTSNGGGGKGIRRVNNRDDCLLLYRQVRAEVSDGIVFAMKCVDGSRHVEIQIVGDGNGQCIALSGRDCSVQRRHQKLIEEGPPPFIRASTLRAMESAAERLCASVAYRNAGTVEFLYKADSDEFFFLEVNCRLQVEHPVTELLWDLNLPFIQLMIAEGGTPLSEIHGIKQFLHARKTNSGVPSRHVVACRIVAEDPVNKWVPSSGDVYEIKPPLPSKYPGSLCYFSLSSSGSRVHQYADSQIGHIFVSAKTRTEAIACMHDFLNELVIVGSVSTNVQFMSTTLLNPSSEFAQTGPPNTNWLDHSYARKSSNAMTRILSFSANASGVGESSVSLALLAVCAHLAMSSFRQAEQGVLKWVRKGHRAPHVPSSYSERLICPGGEHIHLDTARTGSSTLAIRLEKGLLACASVDVQWVVSTERGAFTRAIMNIKDLDALPASVLVSVVAVSATKLRGQVGNEQPWHQFEVEEDKSKIFAPMNGRLVRWLVPNGTSVVAGDRVCEVEAMKMIAVVVAKAGGQLVYKVQEGISFIEGDVLGTLEDAAIAVGTAASSVPSTPMEYTGLDARASAVGGLLDLLGNVERIRSPEDIVNGILDGFTGSLWKASVNAPTVDHSRLLAKFFEDEGKCSLYIPSAEMPDAGHEVRHLEAVAAGSDEEVISAWRHRTNLRERMELIVAAIACGRVSVDVLVDAIAALDKELHLSVITAAGAALRMLGHKVPLPRRDSEGEADSNDSQLEPTSAVTGGSDALSKKRLIAANAGSFYIYDLPQMLEDGVRDMWGGSAPSGVLVDAYELVLDSQGSLIRLEPDTCAVQCGMAAWLVTMRTPELPSGRRAIFIGNDITFHIGTFSVDEDRLYLKASEMARRLGIPRIFIACNSGARLGLCTLAQNLFRVEWINPADVTEGFKYLYLTDADYITVCAATAGPCPVIAKPVDHETAGKIWILSDILGVDGENIGVENLAWSGAIAGESSRAYKETFTLTYVTGRTVGIGAYISRLCQRIIQKVDSPILLTGFQALNKLIGSDVYRSNDEIGGVGVMFRNGVSHLTVKSDSEGIASILSWLQFIPESVGKPLPVYSPIPDPVDRAPAPCEGGRSLIEGSSTLFDDGSFVEVQAAWARSVIAGRARLGGIPIGVIVVETRQTHFFQPADPADPHSHSVARPQAGQVWYPDSAYKTAQAIMDFNHEGLPLMVLANWRGFSGGQRDMFNEILKFGSYIVDALREYNQPVFVYLPPKAELRGGAWVVVDSRINPEQIEMYADPTARGGVLEPSGITEIKFRHQSFVDLMMRTDSAAKSLSQAIGGSEEDTKTRMASYYDSVKPTLVQIANAFADMHDTPNRMVHTGAIKAVVTWEHAREFFYYRLRFRLNLMTIKPALSRNARAWQSSSSAEAYAIMKESIAEH